MEEILKLIEGFLTGGKSGGRRPEGLDDETLKRGMEIESEHSDSPVIQAKIVFDHVAENPNYYDEKIGLPAMESGLKNDEG